MVTSVISFQCVQRVVKFMTIFHDFDHLLAAVNDARLWTLKSHMASWQYEWGKTHPHSTNVDPTRE